MERRPHLGLRLGRLGQRAGGTAPRFNVQVGRRAHDGRRSVVPLPHGGRLPADSSPISGEGQVGGENHGVPVPSGRHYALAVGSHWILRMS